MNEFFEALKLSLHERPSKSWDRAGLILKEASVLAPLFWRGDEPWAYATARPTTLRTHAGQVAFPGGGRDETDLTPLHTALREANEELGIPPDQVEVLGMLGTMPTPTGFHITPFVGVISAGLTLIPSPAEIDEVLELPLWRLREEKREAYNAQRDAFVWDGSTRFVWGATHRILSQLMEHVRSIPH